MVICRRLMWSSVGGYCDLSVRGYCGHLWKANVVVCGRLLWSSSGGYCGLSV